MSRLIDALQAEPRQLIALWRDVFGDPPELPAAFLRQLPAIGCGWAAVEEGRVLGAAYWIDALYLGEERCGYLYAVAVRPEARGQGLGAALSRACWESGRARSLPGTATYWARGRCCTGRRQSSPPRRAHRWSRSPRRTMPSAGKRC